MSKYRILKTDHLLQPFRSTPLGDHYHEQHLEDWIELNPQVLVNDEPLLVIGRQVNSPVGVVDLLGLTGDGSGIIVELKRAPNPRDTVAQILEYVSWFSTLDPPRICALAEDYLRKRQSDGSFSSAWRGTFNTDLPTASLNARQRLFVLTEGDHERLTAVARYLRSCGVDINLLRYNYYRTESGEEILDIEVSVGSEEGPVAGSSRSIALPTEEDLLQDWGDAIALVYRTLRDRLAAAGLAIRPKKSGISFNKQTRDGLAFICFVNAHGAELSIWLRADSLQARFDFQAVSQAIRRALDSEFRVFQSPVWFKIDFPSSRERAMKIAELLLKEIVERID